MSSICIPRIESSISKDYIYNTLCNLKIGVIEKITEIPLKNDPTHKRVIIKMLWNKTCQSNNIKNLLASKGSFKVVHDMPWYWKIVPTYPQI